MKDQKSRLYAAETQSRLKGKEEFTLKQCEQYVNKIWKRKYVQELRSASHLRVGVTDGRRRRSACASYRLGIPTVTLPKWARHEYVMLHELAHLIAGLGNEHNPKFATVLLKLVRRELGKEQAERLLAAFSFQGVKILNSAGKPVKARCPKSQKQWFLEEKQKKQQIKELDAKIAEERSRFIEAVENQTPVTCAGKECDAKLIGKKTVTRYRTTKVQIIWETECDKCGYHNCEWQNEIFNPIKHGEIYIAGGRRIQVIYG